MSRNAQAWATLRALAQWSIASQGLLMHIRVHKGSKDREAAALSVSDTSRDTGDWLLAGNPALLDMGSLLITGLSIEALHGEYQLGLMALMVLSLGIVCRQYAATELAQLGFLDVFGHSSRESVLKVCSKQQSDAQGCKKKF